MDSYGVIMAGGEGTRFWPLSRKQRPKQLLNLTGKDVMINEAYDRLKKVEGVKGVFIVTNKDQKDGVLKAAENRITDPAFVLSEPEGRNTAACIGYAAVSILERYGDAVMVITPADHYIKDEAEFKRILDEAVAIAKSTDKLVTIGIKPESPSTGFGYIEAGNKKGDGSYEVASFKEKPDLETAEEYLSKGTYYWNSGMFVWRASMILEKFKELVPDIYESLIEIKKSIGTDKEEETVRNVYPTIRKISIDYAVMEPSAGKGDVIVIPGDFGWNDIGSFDMLNVLHEENEYGNISIGDSILIDTKNTYAYSTGRTIAALGVENLIIVETSDAILVCDKDRSQDIKTIVEQLKAKNKIELI